MTADISRDGPRSNARRWTLVVGAVALGVVVTVLLVQALAPDDAGPGRDPRPPTLGGRSPAVEGGWDVAAQTALATRPMLQLPDVAAQPHALAIAPAGPPLVLPPPTQTAGRWIPGGFPATPEGAVAQLAALTAGGFVGGDPQVYAQAYQSIALPGAPRADRTRLATDLQRFRARAGLPRDGAVPGLSATWRLTSAQVKGTTDSGRYVVACVLGELTVTANGQVVTGGGGDCQALRYVDGNWQISPGAAAAPAPLAWPGTAEAIAAGYRAVG